MHESFFILYKEHLDLSVDEISTIIQTLDSLAKIQVISNLIIVNSKIKSEEIARKASFVRISGQILKKNFQMKLEKSDIQIINNKTFACRIINLSSKNLDIPKLENLAGKTISKLSNAQVKLENPDLTVHLIFTENESFLGVSPPKIKEKRPVKIHNHPHQLDWKLTRAMINLIGLEQGKTICDPFCGTGTTLLEAEFMGMHGIGLDFDKKMWQKSKENLEANGYKSEVFNSDFQDLERFEEKFDAIVTDLPYGRASKTSEKPEKMLEKLLAISPEGKKIAVMYKKTPKSDLRLQGLKTYEIYRHKSLTRAIVIR